ncbi:unnamed protein product [Rotaria sordida]|uniref:Uncharacterized protein n=1 Tax=Rotaria sordida TaxID=392033 RepID=A0A814DHM7_9BILA|nr:unnamed protein product [Rotaria sordida]CAF0954263.1 unnamed protein product [Rotaria sordida]
MYASNEDEFNNEDNDWVFLRQTSPPENPILHGAVNLVDHEQSNLSFSSNTSNSSSSKSDRSDSVSSLSSIEHEHIQTNNDIDQQENHLLIEDSMLINSSNDNSNNNDDVLLTGEIKEEILSSEIIIEHDNETTPIFNEYDLNDESIQLSNNLRQHTGAYVQHTVEQSSLTNEYELVPYTRNYYRPRQNKKFVVYGFLIFIIVLQLILGRIILSQRLMINKLTEELNDTNQHLNKIKSISNENIEQKLTKKFEEKFQILINQKMIEYNNEKNSLILKINELHQIINFTQENFTNMIHQLSDENEQLQQQVIELEHHVQLIEEQNSIEKETCPEGVDCTKSSSTLSFDALLNNLIKQATLIAENTSTNLSDLFQDLSASLSHLVDHGHEYIEQSEQILSDIIGSQAAEQVQMTLRRGIEFVSSSFREAQSTYATWIRSRAQHREEARMNNAEQEEKPKGNGNRWRWTFQRSHDREQMRHQPSITKKHSLNKEHFCRSRYPFPTKHFSSMKDWMAKFFGS